MCRSFTWLTFVSLSLYLMCAMSAGLAADLYVAPFGDDRDAGTLGEPVATINQALKLTQALRANGITEPMTIWLREGTYSIRSTLTISGSSTAGSALTFRAYPGEQARLSGGLRINPAAFALVNEPTTLARLDTVARGKVYMANLRAQGITDYGAMHARGFGYPIVAAPLEFFFNKKPMTLARWPNSGYSTIAGVIGDAATGTIFTYAGDRPTRWRMAEDPWLYGFWCWNWADMTLKLQGIDTVRRRLTLATSPKYGLRIGARFYALNMLEELDSPGEWYLNRSTGILYFWPPQTLQGSEITVSMMSAPFFSLRGTKNVTFRDLIFEYSRGPVVQIISGSYNTLVGCTLRNLGSLAVVIGEGDNGNVVGLYRSHLYTDTAWNRNAGQRNGINACDIYNTGEGAVILGGGNRKTLTPGSNFLTNTHIANINRASATSMGAVMVDGVGQYLAHNYIHDGPYSAIMLNGNDHIIEYNHICRMVTDCDDAGAFYIGRNPSEQGNIVRYNFWQDIGSTTFMNNKAIFLDDGTCGTQVYGNTFYKAVHPSAARVGAVFVNGGKDNSIDNNVFIGCNRAFGVYLWGSVNWQNFLTGNYLTDVIPLRLHGAVEISQPPFNTRYPLLATLSSNAGRNYARRNLGYGTGYISDASGQVFQSNWQTMADPGFRNAAAMDFQLLSTSIVYQRISGFQNVPFSSMGLTIDQYRTSKPYLSHSAELNTR